MLSFGSRAARFAGLVVLIAGLPLVDAASATPPDAWPLGHHTSGFQRGPKNTGAPVVSSSGWDPAYLPSDDAAKSALVSGLPTFTVGLRNGAQPSNLPVRSTASTINQNFLSGYPRFTLTNVGTVYLVKGHRFDGPITIQDGVKVAFVNSSFRQIKMEDSGGRPTAWFVDCVIDANSGDTSALTAFRGDFNVMYSEVLGGTDISKIFNGQLFYRSHLHSPDKPGDGHSDGIQSRGGANNWLIQSNVEMLFRMTNGGVYITNNDGPQRNWHLIGNLLGGGQNPLRVNGSEHEGMIVWGNRFLGKQGNVSWSLDSRSESDPVGGSGLGAIDRADDNLSIDGRVSGTDHKGRSWSLGSVNGNPPDAGQRSAIAAKLAQLDAWVADIRSAGGYSNDNPAPNPPPPPPPSGPVAPTLLD